MYYFLCYMPLSKNERTFNFKWMYKVKYNFNNFIEKFNARLVIPKSFQVQ